jgi:hypothetical protein
MKKFDGMMPPTLVWAEAGKNGDLGPPPSPSMASGGLAGFTIRFIGVREKLLVAMPEDRQRDEYDQRNLEALFEPQPSAFLRGFFPDERNERRDSERCRGNMRPEYPRVIADVPGVRQKSAKDEREQQEANRYRRAREQLAPSQNEEQGDGEHGSQDDMRQHVRHVEHRGRRERRNVARVHQQHEKQDGYEVLKTPMLHS